MNENTVSRAGKIMFFLAWIAFFAMTFSFFYFYTQKENGSHELIHGKLLIKSDRQGHYRVPGKINGYAVMFMLDTGATTVAIPQTLAKKIGLSGRYPITVQTASGSVEALLTRLDSLEFGQFKLHDIKAVIVPGKQDEEVLMGMNVLKKFQIIQNNNELVIKP